MDRNLQCRLLRWRASQPVFTFVRKSADRRVAQPAATKRRPPSSLLRFGLLNAQSVGNKHTAISDVIGAGEYDVFLLTETWHTASTDVALTRCAPPGFSIIDEPRPSKTTSATNHGGITAVINDHLTYRPLTPPFKPRSFESTCFSVSSLSATIVILLRPGSNAVTSEFFVELTKYLESLALYKCQIVITGDFNIHVEATDDSATKQLHDILDSIHCTQHIPLTETHTRGSTLDLLITKSDQLVEDLQVDPPGILSDHSLISWRVPIQRQPSIVQQREVRSWARVNRDEFRAALLSSELCDPKRRPDTAEDFFEMYHSTLQSLADRFAPVRKIKQRCQRLAPWMDNECRRQRRQSRRLERRYRRTLSTADRQACVAQERARHQVYRQKERAYWSAEISLQTGQPRKMWRTLNTILGRNQSSRLPRNCLLNSSLISSMRRLRRPSINCWW